MATLLIFVVAFMAGAVNVVAGAGSLLVLPALLFVGLDAASANATNRVGILAQSLAAVWSYQRAGQGLSPPERTLIAWASLGGALGAFVATLLSARELELAIVGAMLVMLWLAFRRPRHGDPRPLGSGAAALFVLVGAYGGFLQAGVGILAMLVLMQGFGVDTVRANVIKAFLTLALSLIALVVFGARGESIDASAALALVLGAALGASVGARWALEVPAQHVRRFLQLAIVLSLLKLVHGLVVTAP